MRKDDGQLHTVEPGDCVESLAARHGLMWKTIWDHPRNARLKRQRKDPLIIQPGDRLFIPARRERTESRPTEQRHRFKRKGVPSRFRLRLLREGRPRADLPFTLTIDGVVHEGKTDAEGWLEVPIPPDAREGELRLTPGDPKDPGGLLEERIPVRLGGLDPVESTTGLQHRLENLGFACGAPGELDEETRAAVAAFQAWQEIEATGEPDGATRQALVDAHGS